jgi:hypothetical protein
MSEEKQFANMYWNYEDVHFNAGYVSREEADEFLYSIERRLFSFLAEMGNEFIRSAWMDEHPDWEFKDEEDDDEEEVELKKEEPTIEASSPSPEPQIVFEYTCEGCQKVCEDETYSKAELDTPICDDCNDKYIIQWDNMDFGTKKEPQCGICGAKEEDSHYRHEQLIEDVICLECRECWWYDSDIDAYRPRTFLLLQRCIRDLNIE